MSRVCHGATQHEQSRKPLYIPSPSVRGVAQRPLSSVSPAPRASDNHGVHGEGEEVDENAHQEVDQLCVRGEGEEVVCQTQEQEEQRWRRTGRLQQVGEEDPSSVERTTQKTCSHPIIPGRPGEREASYEMM